MKHFLFLNMVLIGFGIMQAQSMKMVVDRNGNAVGRYIKTGKTTYTIGVQDEVEVPKKGLRVVTFRAEKGQGGVYHKLSRTGNINVRRTPSVNAPIISKIPELEKRYECFDCLGKVNGWYKIRIDGKVGYVRYDMVDWDGMCTF